MKLGSPGRAAVQSRRAARALSVTCALSLMVTFALLGAVAKRARAQADRLEEHADDAPAPPGPLPPPAAMPNLDANALLTLAEDAMTQIDYARSRELASAALARGKLDSDGLVRAYRLIAVSSAQLGEDRAAEEAFIRLFALEPDSTISTRLAPQRRSSVLNARGFWSVRRDSFGMDVSYARRERQIVVRVRDPLRWGHAVHVWYRIGGRAYVKQVHPISQETLFDVQSLKATDPVEVYAFLVDDRENVLTEFGRERDPHLFGLSEGELEEFLRRDIRGGQTGSYALRLEELGVEVGVHGYLSLEFKEASDDSSAGFDMHHVVAMIRAAFQHAVSLEFALEYEHLFRAQGDFYLPHAFMDVKFAEQLILRAGWFEVPVGAFNEYLYPDFLRITGTGPLFTRYVIPGLWSEVGVQLRGRFALTGITNLTYAVFVVNGLEQPDENRMDGRVAEGGEIRTMRYNINDQYNGDKAFGGRLGLEIDEFDIGVSGYSGRYTIERNRRLSIGDVDLSYRDQYLTIRSEAALAWEQTTDEVLHKFGMYFLVAGRPIPWIEPYAQYDFADNNGVEHRVLGGVALYPFPEQRSTRNLRLKSECGVDFLPNGKEDFIWFFQLTTGF
jgi:hypothetical protein